MPLEWARSLLTLSILSQGDCLLSVILFLSQSFVQSAQDHVTTHILILVSAICGVLLSIIQLILISKKEWWGLIATSVITVGPLAAVTLYWMIFGKSLKPHHIPLGAVLLSYQIIKSIWFILASLKHMNSFFKSDHTIPYTVNVSTISAPEDSTNEDNDANESEQGMEQSGDNWRHLLVVSPANNPYPGDQSSEMKKLQALKNSN